MLATDQKTKSNKVFQVAIVGAGRIAYVHAQTLAQKLNNVNIKALVAPHFDTATHNLFAPFKIAHYWNDFQKVLDDETIEVVYICSPTPTHVEYTIKALKAHKAVFCEKPLSLEIAQIEKVKKVIEATQGYFFSAHNRRFDHDFMILEKALKENKIGKALQISITSKDPNLPSLAYLKTSGGIFADMMIHDIDMSRFLTKKRKIKQLYALGGVFLDPELKKFGDYDSATLVITYEDDTSCLITNSRASHYGYDQRIEIQGLKGMLALENRPQSTLVISQENGILREKPLPFFLERYAQAYYLESKLFFQRYAQNEPPLVTIDDALEAILVARAAMLSAKQKRALDHKEIYGND